MAGQTAMELIGVGASIDQTHGAVTTRRRLDPEGAVRPVPGDLLAAFKRRTQQRYVDMAVGPGLAALQEAFETSGIAQETIDRDPVRTGLLLATAAGSADTRRQYLDTYAGRGGKSASATLFSNCGYNIVGAMLARSHNLRGPVLTFGTRGHWLRRLLETAQRMFSARRVDRLLVGRVETGDAVVIALSPSDAGGPRGNPLIVTGAGAGAGDIHIRLAGGETRPLCASGGPEDDLLWRLAGLWWDAHSKAGV